MKKVIHAFGSLASPLQIASTLTNLRISHTLVNSDLCLRTNDFHLAKEQPAWPVILPSVHAVSKYKCDMENQILFVCDSLALLSTCNMGILRPQDIEASMRRSLEYAIANPMLGWKLVRVEPSITDYVSGATKPSYLNEVQTLLYKISNYDLRKEIQGLIIGCLAGAESRTKLAAKLASNHKLDELRILVKDPKFNLLRDAVAMHQRGSAIEVVASATGFENFEILYITRSSAKSLETKKLKSRK